MRSSTTFNNLVGDSQFVLTIAVQCSEGPMPRRKRILVKSSFGKSNRDRVDAV